MTSYETKNKATYLQSKIIHFYGNYEALQAPEATIFELLKAKLAEMRMLDIGVGGGRTTAFFAPEVKSYTAIDYSEGMIEYCKTKLSGRFPEAKFFVADAKDLSRFEDKSFDLILFSFNGIDYMPISSRITVLREVRRVLTPGGYFCFSTHNILSLKNLNITSVIRFQLNILAVLNAISKRIKLRRINAEQLAAARTSEFVFINDGSHNFALEPCYIRTAYQIGMLRDSGFQTIQGFSLRTGEKYPNETDFCRLEDSWLYYLCN